MCFGRLNQMLHNKISIVTNFRTHKLTNKPTRTDVLLITSPPPTRTKINSGRRRKSGKYKEEVDKRIKINFTDRKFNSEKEKLSITTSLPTNTNDEINTGENQKVTKILKDIFAHNK